MVLNSCQYGIVLRHSVCFPSSLLIKSWMIWCYYLLFVTCVNHGQKFTTTHCCKRMWNTTQKSVITTDIYTSSQGIRSCHWWIRYKCFVVCGQLCHTPLRQIISAECLFCILYIKLHKHHALYIWLFAEKDVTFISYAFVDNKFPIHGISRAGKIYADCVGGSSS